MESSDLCVYKNIRLKLKIVRHKIGSLHQKGDMDYLQINFIQIDKIKRSTWLTGHANLKMPFWLGYP